MAREQRAALLGALLSLFLHGGMAVVLWRLPAAAAEARTLDYVFDVHVDGPEMEPRGSGQGAEPDQRPDALVAGGRHAAQNIDAVDRGERGDGRSLAPVVLLMPRVDGATLQDRPTTATVSQLQRIRTARDRATQEDRRSTPNPNDQLFLGSGPGRHTERRPVSSRDAMRGAREAPAASLEGEPTGALQGAGGAASPDGMPPGVGPTATEDLAPGTGSADRRAGGAHRSPGQGIRGGRGDREQLAARVATGRPPVDRGPAATPAEARDSRIRDNHDAEALAASLVQSLVDSTRRSGPERGAGHGGVGGGGAPGSGGGAGEGGRARATGEGGGDHYTGDARYQRWLLDARGTVDRGLVFPRARMLALDQGLVVVRFRVRRDGTLVGRARRGRTSGFEDLDAAARRAVDEARFSPLPAALVPGRETFDVRMTVQFQNPMAQ